MKNLIAVVMCMFAFPAFAAINNIDTNGLTEAQKAQLVQQAEQMKNATPLDTANKVDQWVNIGEKIGKMLGGAAKEVGIAVNEFVQTPVGKMTAVLIVWNYMGSMIVHVLSGWALLIITFSLLLWYSKRVTGLEITYDKEAGRNWLGRYPILKIKRDDMPSDAFGFILFGYAAALAISIWTMFSW